MRLLDLYTHTDPDLAAIMEAGLALEAVAGSEAEMLAAVGDAPKGSRRLKEVDETARSVGRVMVADDDYAQAQRLLAATGEALPDE